MKLASKNMIVIGALSIVIVVVAYQLGRSQGEKTLPTQQNVTAAPQQAEKAQEAISTSTSESNVATQNPHSTAARSLLPEPRFSHFRVGNRNVKGMLADEDVVWVGTSGGVIRYEMNTDDYKLFDVAGGNLLSNGIFHLSKLDGKIVIGTYGGGLSIHDPVADTWKNYNIPDGLADQFVYDVQKVSNGDVWIATWSGVNRIVNGELDNPESWTTFNVENTNGGLPNDWVYGLEEGNDGAMWFATENGLALFQNGEWKNWQHEDGLGNSYEIVKDDIQFSRDPGSASRHHAAQKEEQGLSRINAAYNPNYIVSLEVDNNGIVWCGTWGGGLARFDGKQWKNFSTVDGLPSNHVFMLYKDDDGAIWAGTSHGLAKIVGDKFQVITRKDGLYADNVFSMANASDGSMWIGSFGGVARLYNQI